MSPPIHESEHREALDALVADPTDAESLRLVLERGLADPDGAANAREAIAPAPEWDLVELDDADVPGKPYDRHNLHQPYQPDRVVKPENLPELVAAVQSALAAGQRLKAIGDGYGFSNSGFTTGHMFIMVKHLDRVLPVETDELREAQRAGGLYRFEAGTTFDTLNKRLWKQDQAVWNQPGYEKLTFVGTMSVGGHGSGLGLGPISSQVRSVHLLTVDADRQVVQLQIEPRDGISDPAGFGARFPDVELVQDDDLFHAVTVGVGCLGIIYSVTIEVREKYKIRENRVKYPWSHIRDDLPRLLSQQRNGGLHSIEIWVNPYRIEGELFCVLGTREETTDSRRGHRGIGISLGGDPNLARMIAWWLRQKPAAVPGMINQALDMTVGENVVMRAPKGLNFGPPNNTPVHASSCAIPVEHTVAATEALSRMFMARAESEGAYITSPLGLRFVKAGAAHLSPQFARETCMIECPIIKGTPMARATLAHFHELLFDDFEGRPHWGQINDMTPDRLPGMFPQLDRFLAAYRRLNAVGLFDNAFTEQMGL